MVNVKIGDYNGREQAFVKHRLLGNYLPKWGYKTGSQWDTLVYVDGFAGPWGVQSKDFSDSSFGIAVNALREMRAGQREHECEGGMRTEARRQIPQRRSRHPGRWVWRIRK